MKKEKLKPSYDSFVNLLTLYHNLQRDMSIERATYTKMFINSALIIFGGGIAVLNVMPECILKNIIMIFCGISVCTLLYFYNKILVKATVVQYEYISRCSKIEDLLKFDDKKIYKGNSFWVNEGIMSERHKKDCGGCSSKEEFVNKYSKKGQNKYVRYITIVFFTFGIVFSLYGILGLLKIDMFIVPIA